MKFQYTIFIFIFFISSNLNALNLTNNTSWKSVRTIENEKNPEEILGKIHILLDINDELLSIVKKEYDTNNNLLYTDIITTVRIIIYKYVKNSHLINNDWEFYYEKDTKMLIMPLDDSNIVFERTD